MESKAFRLCEVLVLLVQSCKVHSAREIGWAVVMLLSHGEVECHTDSERCSPFNVNMECWLSLRFNLI